MRAQYRICRDSYAGFEVQVWRWWWPFWVQLGFCNTHLTIEKAREYAAVNKSSIVVEYLA